MTDESDTAPAQGAITPMSMIGDRPWWDMEPTDWGATAATQSQCSSSGGGNGRCGQQPVERPLDEPRR